MKNLKTNWLLKHTVTVFSCVLIIVLGIAFLSHADPVTTTIGENIATNDLSVSGNVTSGTWQGTAVGTQYGGTGQDWSAVAHGNLPYFSAEGALSNLAPGTAGQFLKSQGTGADPAWANVTRSATFVVAANDSSTLSKQQADYVCDGTDDQVQIQAAIDALPDGGGKVLLMEGIFNIYSTISIDRNINLEGLGSEITILHLANNANCNIISFIETFDSDPKALSTIQRMMLDGNKNEQTSTVYGIYQEDGNTSIDIRFFDIWFESINGDAISLTRYWNHHIEWCTFEHCDGSVIELRLSTNNPLSLHIHHNFVTLMHQFMKVSGSGSLASNIKITDNIITNIEKDAIQIPGDNFIFANNIFLSSFDTDNTYYVFKIDTDIYSRDFKSIQIINNQFGSIIGNSAKYFLQITGTYGVNELFISGNNIYAHGDTAAIYSDAGRCDNIFISANLIDCNGVGIDIANSYRSQITNNIFIHANPSIGFRTTNWDARVHENDFHYPPTGTLGTGSYPGVVSNNRGYTTENSGTATITAAQTSVDVTHSLATTPTRIQLTPTTDTAGKRYWISAKGATTFTITIDSTHTSDISFDWRAVVGEGN